MNYKYLESIVSQYKHICIWGFGKIGKSYVYLSLISAGATNLYYCDEAFRKNVSFQGISLISEHDLFAKSSVFVFIAIHDYDAQRSISQKLDGHGIPYSVFERFEFSQLCESVITSEETSIQEKYYRLINDKTYIMNVFKLRTGEVLNLNNATTMNEKIQWLKMNDKDARYSRIVDKYEVKKYVKEKIGEYYVPTIGIWNSFLEIEFDKLPDKFAIKCTHDNNNCLICEDKREFDVEKARTVIDRGINTNFYWITREWPYKTIKHRIIVEPLLRDKMGSLEEYKFMCFNGEPLFFWIRSEENGILTRNFYDINGRKLDYSFGNAPEKRTAIIDDMILADIKEKVRALAEGFKHIRVDTYRVGSKFYIGEMTLYTGSGMDKWHPYIESMKYGNLIRIDGYTGSNEP